MRITIGGTETFYQRIGTGPTLVLLHGWGCNWEIWSPLIPTLSEKYQLIIPDLPGFGKSTAPDIENWDATQYVMWLEKFLAEIIPNRDFVLVGHSLGGKIASLAATHSPFTNHLLRLVIVDASGIPLKLSTTQQLQMKLLGTIPRSFKETIPAALKTKLLSATHSSTDHHQASSQQKKLLQTLVREDIRSELPKITTPTIILWGTNDVDTPIADGEIFHALIPNSQLITFNTGHFPFLEQPTAFLSTVQKVL